MSNLTFEAGAERVLYGLAPYNDVSPRELNVKGPIVELARGDKPRRVTIELGRPLHIIIPYGPAVRVACATRTASR